VKGYRLRAIEMPRALPDLIFKQPGNLAAMPSLRVNGSRECAPDDRLREAIQNLFAEITLDCLVAYASRNDGEDTTPPSRGTDAPGLCRNICLSKTEQLWC
jgi:hypothetical protein